MHHMAKGTRAEDIYITLAMLIIETEDTERAASLLVDLHNKLKAKT
jgi:hypothetical protein